MNRPMHFEIAVPDPEKAIAFYQQVFGWTVRKWEGGEDYWMLETGDPKKGGINGAVMKSPDGGAMVVNYMQVTSIDEYLGKCTGAGAKVMQPKTEIPGVGFIAVLKDPAGLAFGLFQVNDPGDGKKKN